MGEGECTCHINPPCSYCTEKEPCIVCGELVHPDEAEFVQKAADDEYGSLCEKCYEEVEE